MQKNPRQIETDHFHNKNYSIMKEFRDVLFHFGKHFSILNLIEEVFELNIIN